MGNVLVLYESNYRGHTAKMAELVADGASSVAGISVRTRSVAEAGVNDALWAHGIALGSPTNLGTVSYRMKQWWDERFADLWLKMDGKLGCAFSSSSSWGGGTEHTCQTLKTILMNFGMLVFGVPDHLGEGRSAPQYGAVCVGEPRGEIDTAMCNRLGRRLAEWVAVYFDGNDQSHPARAEYQR